MSRVKMEVARARRLRVLEWLHRGSDGAGRTVVSLRLLALETGLTYAQARSVVRHLAGEGLVEVEHRALSNGGAADNAYSLTDAGRKVLERALERG